MQKNFPRSNGKISTIFHFVVRKISIKNLLDLTVMLMEYFHPSFILSMGKTTFISIRLSFLLPEAKSISFDKKSLQKRVKNIHNNFSSIFPVFLFCLSVHPIKK